jgi:hypothetical protein
MPVKEKVSIIHNALNTQLWYTSKHSQLCHEMEVNSHLHILPALPPGTGLETE